MARTTTGRIAAVGILVAGIAIGYVAAKGGFSTMEPADYRQMPDLVLVEESDGLVNRISGLNGYHVSGAELSKLHLKTPRRR